MEFRGVYSFEFLEPVRHTQLWYTSMGPSGPRGAPFIFFFFD